MNLKTRSTVKLLKAGLYMLSTAGFLLAGVAARPAVAGTVKLVLWDQTALETAKSQYAEDPHRDAAVVNLLEHIDKDLKEPIHTVMDKKITPPSGDKHDYMSISKYWWPDPNQPNGIPYVNKDGQVNPQNDIDAPDRANVENMGKVVKRLALAGYITGKSEYSKRGGEWVKKWFVDSSTRMNPNLDYAISVPGKYEGHPNGCVEIHFLAELIDSVILLHEEKGISDQDLNEFRDWSKKLLEWLSTSKKGKTIAKGKQNISTWYDTEIIALGLFTNELSIARKEADDAKERRIDSQMDPTGILPEEIKRTQSLGYSIFDLQAFCELAVLSDHVGVDLWKYESPNGGSLKKSVDFILPYLYQEKPWPHEQIHEFKPEQGFDVLYLTAGRFGAAHYKKYLDISEEKSAGDPARLYFPKPA